MIKKFSLVCVFMLMGIGLLSAKQNYLLVDNMSRFKNSLNGKCGMYMQRPSKIHFIKPFKLSDDKKHSDVLKIRWIRSNEGGPYGKGGWCGYYTLLKIGRKYLDVKKYKYISFSVRGEKGGENFVVGLADKTYEQIDDSFKSKSITEYLKNKKITKKWQTVKIPLKDFFIEFDKVFAISIDFYKKSKGIVYIDDIRFEK